MGIITRSLRIVEKSIKTMTKAKTKMMKANLVRGGVSNGDAGQEELSSTSVGDNYIKSVTNSFVEEEVEEGGGLLKGGCRSAPCVEHKGNEKACKGQGGCYWYSHLGQHIGHKHIGTKGGLCSTCAGVNCGTHRAPACNSCPSYDGEDKGKVYCSGDCKWNDSTGFSGSNCELK